MAAVMEEPGTVADRLAGRRLLLTGATGFVGKAVLATWLREVPEHGELLVLVRAPDAAAAQRRLTEQVLTAAPFAALTEATERALADGRLRAIPGDLEALARTQGTVPLPGLGGVDVLVHCAASVSFEQPLDEIVGLNVLGTLALLDAVEAAGSRPDVIHVSTAYAAGRRTGLVLERAHGDAPAEPSVDLAAELAAARAWRAELEASSRTPEHQRRFTAEAREEVGPAGDLAVGGRAERARAAWVREELVERGRQRSRGLGWSDAYALSKALAERAVAARGLERLTIVRPTIIESALAFPHPGWLEGIKVADPVILAYGRGMISRFPAEPSARLDVVPVDLVAHACVAAAAHPPAARPARPRVLHVASGARNPLRIGEITALITEEFRADPLPDEDGVPVEVPEWRFTDHDRALRALARGDRALAAGRRLLDRVAVPKADDAERRLHTERRALERLRRLTELYGPYVELDCVFDDREAQALAARLAPADRARLGFDPAAIDWDTYLRDGHLPALRAIVTPPRPPRPTVSLRRDRALAAADGPPALAVLDVEGVVLDTTIGHAYAWLRGRTMPQTDRALWLATLAARTPGWKVLDRSSRAAFNRRFYEQYAGLPADELRDHATDVLGEFLLPRVQQAAVRRIRAHRRRGDRVVLLTGALDFLVAPLAHLADEVVAARLVERDGQFTGELAEPPLTADGRASTVAALADHLGVDLADTHAYGDAVSDLPMLALVGHPHVVNPDFRLAREARRRRWDVLEWATEPGAATTPVPA
jgi:HAD superfamily hydrolase (TIGR01490 family)